MMLKQDVKLIKAEVIQSRALSQLSFVYFRPYAILLVGLFLSLTLTSKSKKTLKIRVDLTPSFKTSVDR